MLFQIYKGKIQPKFRQSVANQRAEHLFPHALLCSLKTKSLNFLLQFEVLEKSALRNGRKCFKILLDREDNSSIQYCLQLKQVERNILLFNRSRNCVVLVSMVRLGSRETDWNKEQVVQEMEVKPGTYTRERIQERKEIWKDCE